MAFIVGKETKILGDTIPVLGHSATPQAIFTAPAAKQAVITKVVVRVLASFPPTTPCSAKIEINPAAGDILPEEVLVDIFDVGDQWVFVAEARGLVVPAGAQVDMTITVAANQDLFLAVDTIGYIVY
jgi:hypothetical protein